MRALERSAEITTRYGGGFVQSIEGLEARRAPSAHSTGSSTSTGSSQRWAPPTTRCTGESRSGGTTATGVAAMRVPAVVGSWPQPFLNGYDGKRHPVAVECLGGGAACGAVRGRLEDAGVDGGRQLAGRRDPGVGRALGAGAERSGGGADRGRAADQWGLRRLPAGANEYVLQGLDEDGEVGRPLGRTPAWSRRPAATTRRRSGSSPARARPGSRAAASCSTPPTCATTTRSRSKGGRRRRFRCDEIPLRLHAEAGTAAGRLAGRRCRLPRLADRRSPSSTRTRSCSWRPASRWSWPVASPAPALRSAPRSGWA